jgi:predicted nucleic acid-binding Zn ribbon protein
VSWEGEPEQDAAWVHDEDDVLREVRGPTRFGSELSSVVSGRGWGSRLEGAAIFGRWEEIVGAELARRCQPVRLAGGVLLVRAESAAWATQVGYLAHGIVTRTREVLGSGMVRTVKVTVGPLDTGSGTGGTDGDERTDGAARRR